MHLSNWTQPGKFAAVVERIIDTATPRKRQALTQLRVTNKRRRLFYYPSQRGTEGMKNSKEGKKAVRLFSISVSDRTRELTNDSDMRAGLGLNRKLVARAKKFGIQRRPRRDCMMAANKKKVHEFYLREDVSRVMPDKRFATKKYGAGHVLQIISRFLSLGPLSRVCLWVYNLGAKMVRQLYVSALVPNQASSITFVTQLTKLGDLYVPSIPH